jgi:hypothetical protein
VHGAEHPLTARYLTPSLVRNRAVFVSVFVCDHDRPIPGEIEGVVQAVEEDKRDRPDFFESW